ncbi:MAG: LacI family transcriptional regulator [Treponema sp.]|jgi:DNA-binding LacI/PurR family transcriptional regulator|nr:LacI family transcriptional regulator [Treponema sp.]
MADPVSPVTILDVARFAKVSPSTVSHALNGKRPVGNATKERILSAIESLGYIPSYSASHLRKGSSGIIGCYTLDITETFSNKIVKGIERGLAGSGLSMLFVSGIEFGNDFSRACRFLQSHDINGLLLCNHIPITSGSYSATKDLRIPVISINMELEDLPSVLPDNFSGGIIAAEHLYASGMRRPAMICGPENGISVNQRLQGFRERIMDLGLEFEPDHYMFGEYTYEQGYEAAFRLMKTDPRIDGIFCANDYIAAGAINRLTEMGRKIPGDIRIIGFDDRDFARFWHIPISTFEQPLEEMGFIGMSALRCAIFSALKPQEPQILQSKLIARTSTIGADSYKRLEAKISG